MCRARAEGGRRCPGGHSTTPDALAARQRLCRARKALTAAQAADDRAAIAAARRRVADAQEGVQVARTNAGADRPDVPNAAGLRRAEREAVSAYTGGMFAAINEYILNACKVPDWAADDRAYVREMRATAAALKRAVNRSKLMQPTRVTRGTRSGTAEQFYGPVGSKVGQILQEDRFTSTTFNPQPDPANGDVTLVFDLAPGTRALDINSSGVACKENERELLLGPHQRFRMVADDLVDGRRVVRLESAVGT